MTKKNMFTKRFVAAAAIFLHIFTQAIPASFAEIILDHVENIML